MKWFPLFEDKKLRITHPGSWCPVLEYVSARTVLRIEAEGKWLASAKGRTCGPDGTVADDPLPLERYPLGSLVGKLGGSTAGQQEGGLFAIGRYCVVNVGETGVPLYVAINIAGGIIQPADAYLELRVSTGV